MNVRRDVQIKLIEGLENLRERAEARGRTPPKCFRYDTPKATHIIWYSEENDEYWMNSRGYNGQVYHTTLKLRKWGELK